MKGTLDIIHVSNRQEAGGARTAGYVPVECSFGQHSVVDNFGLDHHGEFSQEEGVALKAYQKYFGKRKDDPRFVVTGFGDSDATFAIAAMSGLLPDPEKRNLTLLADLINRADIDPLSVNLLEERWGPELLFWHAVADRMPPTPDGFKFGIALWGVIATKPEMRPLIQASKITEKIRIEEAHKAPTIKFDNDLVMGVTSDLNYGWDIWYGRLEVGHDQEDQASWEHPIVVQFHPTSKNLTVGCPNKAVAEKLFGTGGLKNVFKALGEGWGGREAIGGSPRGEVFKADILPEVCEKIIAALNPM
jgi:hypothetical protein